MLGETIGIALYHDMFRLVAEKKSYYRGFRNNTDNLGLCHLVSFHLHDLFMEAGTVVGVDPLDLFLHFLAAEHGGKHGEITAFGMAAQPEGLFRSHKMFVHIRRGMKLSQGIEHVGHIEVFLPAHERAVGAAKGDIVGSVLQLEGHHGKLLFPFVVHLIEEPAQAHIFKPRRFHSFFQHPGRFIPFIQILLVGMIFEESLPHFRQSNRAFFLAPGNVVIIWDIRQFREDEIVHLVKRILFQRKISSPVDIIQHISHATASLVRLNTFLHFTTKRF